MTREVEFPHSKPVPTGASKARIHSFAENAASQLGFGPGDSIEPLVNRLGGRIAYKNAVGFSSRLPESIVVTATNNFIIYVPSMTSIERDRFTIAHELAHLFLHYPLAKQAHPGLPMVATRWVDENDATQKRAEWEANWFAAAFLMPEAAFRKFHQQFGGSVAILASKFGVSPSAAEVRCKTLGING